MPPIVKTREPRARDRIEVTVPGKGNHPAVVLHVEPGMMVLAVGSTTPINEVEICAVDRDPELRTMRLRQGDRTIFYECHIQPTMLLPQATRQIWGMCPPKIFDKLIRAMEKVSADARAGTRVILSIPRNAAGLVAKMLAIGQPAAAVPDPDGNTPSGAK